MPYANFRLLMVSLHGPYPRRLLCMCRYTYSMHSHLFLEAYNRLIYNAYSLRYDGIPLTIWLLLNALLDELHILYSTCQYLLYYMHLALQHPGSHAICLSLLTTLSMSAFLSTGQAMPIHYKMICQHTLHMYRVDNMISCALPSYFSSPLCTCF